MTCPQEFSISRRKRRTLKFNVYRSLNSSKKKKKRELTCNCLLLCLLLCQWSNNNGCNYANGSVWIDRRGAHSFCARGNVYLVCTSPVDLFVNTRAQVVRIYLFLLQLYNQQGTWFTIILLILLHPSAHIHAASLSKTLLFSPNGYNK